MGTFAVFIFALLAPALAGAQLLRDDGHVDYSLAQGVIINGEVVDQENAELHGVTARLEIVRITNTVLRAAEKSGTRPEVVVESSRCSGTVIAPEVILTAAHCIEPDQWARGIFVTVGTTVHRVKSYVRHPRYRPLVKLKNHKSETFRSLGPFRDLALVFLDEKIVEARTAILPLPDFRLSRDAQILLAGFGVTQKADRSATTTGADPLLPLSAVSVTLREGSSGQLLVNGPRTVCSGDSGGPALLQKENRYLVVGVAAASDCFRSAVFTRVSSEAAWIHEQIERHRAEREI